MSSVNPFISSFQDWATVFMHRSMRGHARYSREMGLSRSMLGTLYFLNHRGNAGVSDLGDHMMVSNAAASQMLEKLVEEGLIERVEDPADRRMKKITLTEKGQGVVKESIDARLDWIDELAEKLTLEEKDRITEAIQLMTEKVRELYPCPDQHKHHNRSNT